MSDAHRCIADRDCCRGEYVNDRRQGALIEVDGTLCDACHTRIGSAIRQLPRDFAELASSLGDRAASTGQRIRSTPTPAIPISTRKQSLMGEIVDAADRAAAVISDRLRTEQPTGRRKRPQEALPGSIAWCAAEHARPDPHRALTAAVAITQPNVDILAAAKPEPALIWSKPCRCGTHKRAIVIAEAMLEHAAKPADLAAARDAIRRAYAAAGACDDCNGWWSHGQQRELVDISGLDIALQLVDLHNQARAELGFTRLRHKYELPCPNCGSDVGRDDGTTIVDCKTCESSWTEREYKFLVGLVLHERLDMEITKYLLAEAYERLDKVAELVEKSEKLGDDTLELPGAGKILNDFVRAAIEGHQPPDKRVPATDREAAAERQNDDDNWTFGNEPRYKRPKIKNRPAPKTVENPIHPQSLTTLIDIDEDAVINGDPRCRQCNMIHAGDCA